MNRHQRQTIRSLSREQLAEIAGQMVNDKKSKSMALSAQELRIGNWILDHEGTPRQVAYIGETIGLHNGIGGTQKYQHNPVFSGDIQDLQPVDLTPEVLEAAGLIRLDAEDNNTTFDHWEINGLDLLWEHDEGFCMNGFEDRDIQYLHQLQNLYHSLTGEELAVSL